MNEGENLPEGAAMPTEFHARSAAWKWALLALSGALSLRYLIWRATHTLNYESDLYLVISVLLLCAECYGFLAMILFFVQVVDRREHAPVPISGEPPTVDVLIAIYNEPLDILRRTLIACRALDYPAERLTLFVLDDGKRPEVAELAKHYGARYVTREKRVNAKAGNQNNALQYSRGELFVALDVDHIPVSSFLQETVGFFQRDPKLAFVQTPHHFYNPDCYQRNLVLEDEVTHEQDLFFQVIQPGRDGVNAVVFAGSSAVFRRAAIDEIGGFRVDCAIEDLHTGMELQSRGWRSLYYRRLLSAGLSPEDFSGYLTQRMRWTRGGVQLFFLDNPLLKSGLSWRQRLCYLASLLYFFHAWARIVYLLAPLSFLLLRCNPIVTDPWTLLWYFIPHYAALHWVFHHISREYRSPFWSDVYETASVFALFLASILAMFLPETVVFHVTPKGIQDGPNSHRLPASVYPHFLLLALLVAGVIKSTYHFIAQGSMSADAWALSGVWAAFNFVLTACAIEVARQLPHHRDSVRLERSFPAVVRVGAESFSGVTLDVSETGVNLDLPGRHELPAKVVALIGEGHGAVLLPAEVKRARWRKDGKTNVGLRFYDASEIEREKLLRLIFCRPDSWTAVKRPNTSSSAAMGHIAASVLRKRLRSRGMVANAEAELMHAAGSLRVRIEDLKSDSAMLTWPDDFSPDGAMTLRLPHRRLGHVDVRVESDDHVAASAGTHSHVVKFLAPARLRIAPVLDALEIVT
jgi:cellulose synthase (UDP-forming)